MKIDKELLLQQINALLKSDIEEDLKEGIHSLLGEIYDLKEMDLHGCISKNGSEIDGQEFEVETLEEFINIIKNNKEVHLNFLGDSGEHLDLWVKTE